MSIIFHFSKLLHTNTDSGLLLFSHIQSRFSSAAAAYALLPTHQQIADLILEQKSASQALQTFEWAAKIPNFAHTPATYRALIHKVCTFRQFRVAHQLLDEMPRAIGLPVDDDTFITVARGYSRARMLREVIRVLDLVPKLGKGAPSLKLLNTILDILVKEDIDIAREFYRKKIMGSGVKGDDYTYGILMKGFCLTNRINDGFKLLQLMKSHNVKVSVVVYNTLMYALCKNKKVGRARSLMHEMKEFSEVTFNILISAYCDDKNLVQALVMMEKCFTHGFVPDLVTMTKVVEILCQAGRLSEAVDVLERVESKGGTLDVVAYNTLLKGFVKAGKFQAAYGILKQMEMKGHLPNTETYNVMITGFCDSGMLDSASDMFQEMKRIGVPWNFVTFEALIHGFCSYGRTKDGFKIFELMVEAGGDCDGRIGPYNSILYGLYRDNFLNRAYEFLSYMRNLFPRAVDWSSRILQLCEKGSVEEAKQMLDEMRGRGSIPSALLYATLIQGMCKKGLMKEPLELISEMIGFGFFPLASTVNHLVDSLCRQGKIGAALRLLDDLNIRGCSTDSESYALVIKAMLIQGELSQALMLLMQMAERGVAPDYCTWYAVVLATLKRKNLFQVHELQLLQWSIEA